MIRTMLAGFTHTRLRFRLIGGTFAVMAAAFLATTPSRGEEGIDYTVTVEGVAESELQDAVLEAAQISPEGKRPVTTLRALRRRVEAGLPRVKALLRSRAYYAADQSFTIARESDTSAAVTLRVDLGPAYRLDSYVIRTARPADPRAPIHIMFKDLGLELGDVARSDLIAEADQRLLAVLGRKAYPLARIQERKVVVDHKARALSVDIALDPGPYARFGPVDTDGLEEVQPGLVARHLAWTRGAPFDAAAVEATRAKLRQTGLFSSVQVRHGGAVDAQGMLPITIKVTERKHRSIGAGVSFSTTEGILGTVFWEHRNFWGHGERLRLRAEAGTIRQGLFGDLRLSDFGAKDQDLVFDARANREEPEGFTSLETAATARLERRFSDTLAGSAGIGFDRSDVKENDVRKVFTLVTLPLTLRRDTSDDLLDPSRGGRDTLTVTPNIGVFDTDLLFHKVQLYDTAYLSILPEKTLILAGWARIGTLFGESTLDIPANKRLYAGGPGSIRGYALNSIGPLDAEDDPVGGRSSTEFGAELRWRITESIGLVAFAEAGGIYDDTVPDWGSDLFWGAGLGARYLTKIGPLRLDVALPLNRRSGVDDAFQILVSLGQAF